MTIGALLLAGQLALQDVSVLDVKTGAWLPHRTVLVEHGTLRRIAPAASGAAASAATVVDGRGRFLIPGLIDAHVHLFSPDDLVAYLTHGVTTVVNMHGTPSDLALRAAVRSGKRPGPRIYTAGPTIDGNPPLNETFATAETPDQARTLVRSHKQAGYDFIKVYGTLRPDVFQAVAEECRRTGITLTGHVNRQVDTARVLASGQALAAHAEDLLFARFGDLPAPAELAAFAREVAESGLTVTANLATTPCVARQIEDLDGVLASADGQDLSAAAYSQWLRANNRNLDEEPAPHLAQLRKTQAVVAELVRLLHESGARIVMGSDAAAYGLPGASAWEEIDETRRAGLSPIDALRTATAEAGAYVARTIDPRARLGTIEEGAAADLILLSADPLVTPPPEWSIEGVVVRGRWLPRKELDTLRDETRVRLRREHETVDAIDRLIAAGDVTAAAERMTAAGGTAPLLAEWVLSLKARRAGDHLPQAIALVEMDAARYPRSFSSHLLLAELLFKAGRRPAAERAVRQSLRLQPGNAAAANLADKIETSVRPARFAAGDYGLDVVPRDGPASRVRLRLQHGAAGWSGTWSEGDVESPLEEITAGGDRLWFRAGRDWNAKEIRLTLSGGRIRSGYWCAAFGRNGEIRPTSAD